MPSSTTVRPHPVLKAPPLSLRPAARKARVAPRRRSWARWPIYLFFVSLVIPIELFAGPVRLTPYGIVLLCLIVPCAIVWLSGRAGRIRVPDILILLHALCVAMALMVVHGAGEIPFAGRYIIETFGSYLIARCFIRTADDFAATVRFHFIVIAILLPFAFIESVTGYNFIYNLVGSTVPGSHDARWGLGRAYGGFDHPILFGVFSACSLALVFYVLGQGRFTLKAAYRILVVFAAAFFSLSSGPLSAMAVQIGLSAWDFVTRRIPYRWWILFGLFVAAYVAVDMISTRSPVRVFATYFTFSGHTAYDRIGDWTWGMLNIRQNPVFGIGLNDWVRERWMSASLDVFWVVQAMRYGVPAFLLQAAALLFLCFAVGRRRFRDRRLRAYRTGWLIAIVALIIAGASVHFWNAIFCLFMFLQGSGVWLLTVKESRPVGPEASPSHAPPAAPSSPARRIKAAQSA
jgi:hypothetical protein